MLRQLVPGHTANEGHNRGSDSIYPGLELICFSTTSRAPRSSAGLEGATSCLTVDRPSAGRRVLLVGDKEVPAGLPRVTFPKTLEGTNRRSTSL